MTRTPVVVALSALSALSALPALSVLAGAGCKQPDRAGGPAAGEAHGDRPGTVAAAPALAIKKLGALPLAAEVPVTANIDDTSKGAGFPSVAIYAAPTTFVAGGGELSELKPTLEATKAQLARDPNKLQAFTREEKTADGWILELTRDAMAEPGVRLFGVAIRRTIDGAAWDCGGNARSAAERAKAETMCLSLRAAK